MEPSVRRVLFLALLILGASAGMLHGASRTRISVGVGFGAYFPAPAYGFAGFYYPAYYPTGFYVPAPRRPYYAFVDTDIHPEEAGVYLDGKLIGTADDFDGFPGYLVVKPGRHSLGFSAAGHRSLSFDLNLRPGEMVDLDRKLPKLADGETDPGLPAVASSRQAAPEGGARHGEYGTLRLTVSPPGARVILDGDFFGTAAEVSRLHAGIPLSPGSHRIRVSREGYRSYTTEARITASQEQSLNIDLKRL